MTPQSMIQMDKDVIQGLTHFMSTTTKVNGFNRGQLEEGKAEIKRLCDRIIEKANSIGGSFLAEQQLYVNQILREWGK